MACNLAVISLKLTYGSHMWSFATNFSRVIMHPPVCQLGEFCSHSVVCAEKVIRVITQIYTRRWPRNPWNGLAIWELDGNEIGYLAFSAQPAHLYNSQQGVWEHTVNLGRELRNRIILPLQSFEVSEAKDKMRDMWFRQQVYYLSSSSLGNPGMALQYRSDIPLH